MKSLAERIWDKFTVGDGCWEWTASRYRNGYGQLGRRAGESQMAHRAVYEVLVGPIPEDMEVDHLCKNKGCVRPSHMELVTHLENVRRDGHNLRTHCAQGHPFDETNTMIRGDHPGRACRTCKREQQRKRRARSA